MTDIAKLPKWARKRIELLERRVSDLTADIEKRNANSATAVARFEGHSDTPIYLDEKWGRVRFSVGPRDHDFIEARIKGRMVEIYASGGTYVVMHVTNTFSVGLVNR